MTFLAVHEWEFAARSGLESATYVWGDEKPAEGVWLTNTWQGMFPYRDDGDDGHQGTAPVGSYPPNDYGLHDMAGNVWEWCQDRYRPDYRSGPDDEMPLNDGKDPRRVFRGGGWNSPAKSLVSSYRFCLGPGSSNVVLGLRLAMELP